MKRVRLQFRGIACDSTSSPTVREGLLCHRVQRRPSLTVGLLAPAAWAETALVLPLVLASLASPTWAQPSLPPASSDKPKPAEPLPSPPPPTELDLDKLLGLPGKKPEGTPQPGAETPKPTDEQATDLAKRLTKPELDEAFRQAVDLMGRAADRLESAQDASLTTQRLQEDALRKLDQLIKQAEQNQQQKRQKQRQQQQQQQQQQNQPNQPQQQQRQGQQQQRQQEGRGTNTQELPAPPRRDGELGAEAARGAAWGSLPARVRDALQQGNSDKYSTLYQRLTELYYQRLAEEKPR